MPADPAAPVVDELYLTVAAQRVAAGAAYLDQQEPGWSDVVNLDRLDMQHPDRCVLGQVCGNYYHAPITLFGAVRFGFDADRSGLAFLADAGDDVLTARYAALHTEWARLIRARRGEVDEP